MTTAGSSAPLTRRPSRFGDDFDGLIALMTAVADHDRDGVEVIPDDVRTEYVDDEPGWVRTHIVWETPEGDLAAASAVWHEPGDPENRAYASIDVHPAHRTPELEDEVGRTLVDSTRELAAKPVALRIGSKLSQTWKTGMLERAGFTVDRHYHRMRRSLLLEEPIEPPVIPVGYTFRTLAGEPEAVAWCALYETAFAESHDPPRMSPDERRNYMAKESYLPTATSSLSTTPPASSSPSPGPSVRPPPTAPPRAGSGTPHPPRHRGRGLARALLLTSLHILRADGLPEATLAVDTANPTDAGRLYRSVGFAPYTTNVVYLAPSRDDPPHRPTRHRRRRRRGARSDGRRGRGRRHWPRLPRAVSALAAHVRPGFVRAARVWETGGRIIAFAVVMKEVHAAKPAADAWVELHPDARGGPIEDVLGAALRELAAQLAGDGPLALRVHARDRQSWKTAMLVRCGFANRSFHRMARDLAVPVQAPVVPPGYVVRPLAGDDEVAAWYIPATAGFAWPLRRPHLPRGRPPPDHVDPRVRSFCRPRGGRRGRGDRRRLLVVPRGAPGRLPPRQRQLRRRRPRPTWPRPRPRPRP